MEKVDLHSKVRQVLEESEKSFDIRYQGPERFFNFEIRDKVVPVSGRCISVPATYYPTNGSRLFNLDPSVDVAHILSLNLNFHTYYFTCRDADNQVFVLRMYFAVWSISYSLSSSERDLLERIGLTSLPASNS